MKILRVTDYPMIVSWCRIYCDLLRRKSKGVACSFDGWTCICSFQTRQVPANSAPNTKGNLLPHLHWNPTVRLFLRFRSNTPFNRIRQKKRVDCTVIYLVDNLKIIRLKHIICRQALDTETPLDATFCRCCQLVASSIRSAQAKSISKCLKKARISWFQPFCIRKHPQFLDRHIDLSCVPFVVLFLCQKKPLQIPRSFPVTVHSGEFDD